MNKKKLDLARKRIDKIDNHIFDLIKQRTKVVKVMMDIKNLRKQIPENFTLIAESGINTKQDIIEYNKTGI